MKHHSKHLQNGVAIPLYPMVAKVFGETRALILQQIRFWMEIHERQEGALPETQRQHFRHGRWWVFNTYEEWKEAHFIWLGASTIARHIRALERKHVLISDVFNRRSGDRTKWYTIDFDWMDFLVDLHNGKLRVEVVPPSRQLDVMVASLWSHVITSLWSHQQIRLMRPLPEITSKKKKKEQDPSVLEHLSAWQDTLDELQMSLPRETFDTWLTGAQLLRVEDGIFVIGVEHIYAREWLEQRLRRVMERTLSRIAGEPVAIDFEVVA